MRLAGHADTPTRPSPDTFLPDTGDKSPYLYSAIMMRLEGSAPKGLKGSAQGFNPGNAQNEWFALKGREDTR
jgi:hypothetical protein